jgi:hypothetical protein
LALSASDGGSGEMPEPFRFYVAGPQKDGDEEFGKRM